MEYTLEELLDKYKNHNPLINYFSDPNRNIHRYIGWHCRFEDENGEGHHARNKATAKEALLEAMRMAGIEL